MTFKFFHILYAHTIWQLLLFILIKHKRELNNNSNKSNATQKMKEKKEKHKTKQNKKREYKTNKRPKRLKTNSRVHCEMIFLKKQTNTNDEQT